MSHGDHRTAARGSLVGKTPSAPSGKDLEGACETHIRDRSSGHTFDSVGLRIGIDGETLRLMLDPDDRRVLGASRIGPLLRAFGTPEPFNAYMRLDGNQIGGQVHQLVPVIVRPSSGDVFMDAISGSSELAQIVERLATYLAGDGKIDAVEAAAALRLFRPHIERGLGVCAQLEAIARRSA